MKYATLTLAASSALLLIGCSNEASDDSVPANQASSAASVDAMTNDPANPFGTAEMQMHERMAAATGANASETWAKKMLEHHRGALAMSEIFLAQGGDDRFVQAARKGLDMQGKEIGELERLLAGGISGSGPANPYGPVESRMHDAMMAASGANLSEIWARKMIAHHQGAIDMSDVLIRQGDNPKVVALARRTSDMQRKEIAELQGLLGGGGTAAPQAKSQMAPSPPAKASAPPAPRAATSKATVTTTMKAAPKAPPKAPSTAAPRAPAEDPHAGHDISKM